MAATKGIAHISYYKGKPSLPLRVEIFRPIEGGEEKFHEEIITKSTGFKLNPGERMVTTVVSDGETVRA